MMQSKSKLFHVFAVFVVAVAMVCVPSLSKNAFAVDVTSSSTASITASGLSDGTHGDAYRVIVPNWDDTSHQPKAPQYQWASQVQAWIRSQHDYAGYIDSDGNVTDKFKQTLGDTGDVTGHTPVDNGAASFYDKMAKAIKDNTITGLTPKSADATGASPSGSATATATFSGLSMGSYLVLFKNDMRVYRPSVVNLLPVEDETSHAWKLEDATVHVKSSEVPGTKTVDKKNSFIGEVKNFTLEYAVPVYPANAVNKVYDIYDTLPTGLTLKADSVKIVGIKASQETQLSETTNYTKVSQDRGSKPVSLGYQFNYDSIKDYEKVKITYSAVVNKDAVPGTSMVNHSKVTFSNDPYNPSDFSLRETPGDAPVHTYGIELEKQDATSHTGLPGAEFAVYKANSTGTGPEGSALKLVQVSDGKYRLATVEEQSTGVESAVVSNTGTLEVSGLDLGKYALVETKAPAGYVKLQAPTIVEIKDANLDGEVDENPWTTNHGMVTVTILNSKGFTLPMTGGAGLVLFEVIGAVAVSVGVYGIVMSRKKAQKVR